MGVGSGKIVIGGVGTIEGVDVGFADADAASFVVVVAVVAVCVALDAVCDALLAAWLLLLDDVQPAIDKDATITSTRIATNFFITQVPPNEKINQKR
jgi:hypothetical protein